MGGVIASSPRPASGRNAWGVALFLAITVAGIFYAKWDPYLGKALHVAVAHTMGASLVTGTSATAPAVGWHAAWQYAWAYGKAIWVALIVGLLIGSGVQALLPPAWLLRTFGRWGFGSVALASAAAVPSMMCTCCSAPVAVGLAKSRVSVGAALAYWLANPLLNPATLVFMGFVLGWGWVAFRIVAGLAIVVGASYVGGRWIKASDLPAEAIAERDRALQAPGGEPRLLLRWWSSLWRLALGLLPEYAVVLLVLGAVRAWLFPAMSPLLGHSLWIVPFLAVTGTLFVVPTAGEVPIVQTLMRFGLGAAGAGALLTTLPAVSLPSLLMLGRAVPARVLVAVAGCVVVVGVLGAVAASAWHL